MNQDAKRVNAHPLLHRFFSVTETALERRNNGGTTAEGQACERVARYCLTWSKTMSARMSKASRVA